MTTEAVRPVPSEAPARAATGASSRILVVWCPDWPVIAALADAGRPARLPAVVLAGNGVHACNDAARDHGIKRGMRRRDAQARCPDVLVLDANPDRDARAFDDVLVTLERLRPGVASLRPGLVALRSPGRFYGGEAEAGAVIAEALVGLGVRDVRIGVADELFTAEQAARHASIQESLVVPPGESAAFLRGLPVDVLDSGVDELGVEGVEQGTSDLLRRLGLRTLGDLASLSARDVAARFGPRTGWVHRVLHGDGFRPLVTRMPPPDLACEVGFEPPLEDAEAVCFSTRQTAERFVRELAERQLVCTELTIEVMSDGELATARRWLHPRWFGSTDVIDRLHWQLQGGQGIRRDGGVRAPVERVRLVPEEVMPESVHADGLWGGTDARVERGIARVQGMLGHASVMAPVLRGGRTPAERQAFVSWGERPPPGTGLRLDSVPGGLPWPGSIPPPAPSRVLTTPWPALVVDGRGRPVRLDARGALSGEPARFRSRPPGEAEVGGVIAAWAGPWPVEELWWERGGDPGAGSARPGGRGVEGDRTGRRVARFQFVSVDGQAWLVTYDSGDSGLAGASGWFTEAVYE
jgi:protein ImuB